jgi:hypothetical protein
MPKSMRLLFQLRSKRMGTITLSKYSDDKIDVIDSLIHKSTTNGLIVNDILNVLM